MSAGGEGRDANEAIAAADLEVVATTFRLLSDDEAVDEMLARLEHRLSLAPIELGSPLYAYAEQAGRLLDEAAGTMRLDVLEHAIGQARSAAAAFSPDLTVAAANTGGTAAFGAVQGRRNGAHWLHEASRADFAQLRAAADGHGNRRVAILRVALPDGEEALAEGKVVFPAESPRGYIFVRLLELDWSDEIAAMLSETYELTRSEIEVVRDFYRQATIAQVSDARGRSRLTVRTQLRNAMEKMGIASQVELVRMIGILCATREPARAEGTPAWSDPWGNEQCIRRADGVAAGYTWTGPSDGRPLLVLHGFSHGYLLGRAVEEALAEAGIRLIAPYKHGCGSSGFAPDLSDVENFVAAVEAVVAHEGLRGCPVLALGSGAIPAVLMAARDPAVFRSILCIADALPITDAKLSRLSLIARSASRVGRDFPAALVLAARSGYRNVRRQGIDWYLSRRFSENEPDRRTRVDPETSALLRNAMGLIFTQPPELFAEQFGQRWFLRESHFRALPIPFHIMLGEHDRMLDPAQLRRMEADNPRLSGEVVKGAGELLIYQRPDIALERILQLMDGQSTV